MKFKQLFTIVFTTTLLALVSCTSRQQPAAQTSPAASAPTETPLTTASAIPETPAAQTSSHGGQGGQIIEVGEYHLELVTLPEAGGTHLDFFLQKGDNHEPIPNAKVTAQVQLPDGTQQSLDMSYDTEGEHYAVLLPATASGEYKVVVLSDIDGKKVNGRYTFTK